MKEDRAIFRKALVIAMLNEADHALTLDEIGFDIPNNFLHTYVKQLVIDGVLKEETVEIVCTKCNQMTSEPRYSIKE